MRKVIAVPTLLPSEDSYRPERMMKTSFPPGGFVTGIGLMGSRYSSRSIRFLRIRTAVFRTSTILALLGGWPPPPHPTVWLHCDERDWRKGFLPVHRRGKINMSPA